MLFEIINSARSGPAVRRGLNRPAMRSPVGAGAITGVSPAPAGLGTAKSGTGAC